MIHEKFMKIALDEAKKAYKKDEIPIGACIVKDGKIISIAHNENRIKSNPTRHAEIIAIEIAAKKLQNERLLNCDLYVTKEPCSMCAGAIIHARIERLIIGTPDTKYGACGTVLNICGNPVLNHIPEIIFNVLQFESEKILKNFFLEKKIELIMISKNNLDSFLNLIYCS